MPTKRQRRKRRRRQSSVERAPAGAAEPIAASAPAGARPPRRASGPPQAPWGSFPLTELVVLVALVMLLAGFFVSPPRGPIMVGTGLVLGSLAGLELSVREHFAGYRSHTLLLAGAVGMIAFGGLFVASALHPAICLAAGGVGFAGSAWLFASAFRRRSGGALYRIKG